MNKAFLFDMDGVLVDSEAMWVGEDEDFLNSTFGPELASKLGSSMGVSVNEIFDKAVSLGATIDKAAYVHGYDQRADRIYARAELIPGTEALATYLIEHGFRLGLVSASRQNWIDRVVPRIAFHDQLEVIISINDDGFPSKPAPDGYREALRRLDADPQQSIVLEDSNRGIQSGKAAGCYVIGYRGHLVPGYEQTGADAEADTMEDVIKIVEQHAQS